MAGDAVGVPDDFFRRVFPFAAVVNCYEINRTIAGREVVVINQDNVWSRHDGRTYRTPTDLDNYVNNGHYKRRHDDTMQTVPRQVAEVHIGAVYSGKPRAGRRDSQVYGNELVFDFDITDYNDFLRLPQAPSQEAIDACWPVIAHSLEITVVLLGSAPAKGVDEQHAPYAFKETIAFYSGKKGAHLEVFDERAFELTDAQRADVLAYVTLKTEDERGAMCRQMYKHPNASYLFPLCRAFFEDWVIAPKSMGGGGLFDDDSGVLDFFYTRAGMDKVAALAGVAEALCYKGEGPDEIWKGLVHAVRQLPPKLQWCREALDRAVLACAWPRCDEKVTVQTAHTRKAPFSAHRKTGRIAEPIADGAWDLYEPHKAPLANVLMDPGHADYTAHMARMLAGIEQVNAFATRVRGARSAAMARSSMQEIADNAPYTVLGEVLDERAFGADVEDLCRTTPLPPPTVRSAQTVCLDRDVWLRTIEHRICARRWHGETGMQLGYTATVLPSEEMRAHSAGSKVQVLTRSEADELRIVRHAVACAKHLKTVAHNDWVLVFKERLTGCLPMDRAGCTTLAEAYAVFDGLWVDKDKSKRAGKVVRQLPEPVKKPILRWLPEATDAAYQGERNRFESQVLMLLEGAFWGREATMMIPLDMWHECP